MNILFLTIAYPDKHSRNLYSDLMQEFYHRGYNVYVLCSSERRVGKSTEYSNENGIMVLRQWTLNLTKTKPLEKGLSMILIEKQFTRAIKNYFADVKFDLIIYSTPPITFENVIRFIKKRDACFSYLLLKDIFPQNAVDLGMMSHGSLIWRYFRYKENRLYNVSDFIGCMSKANVEYVLKNNPELSVAKVEECPNSIKPKVLNHNVITAVKLREKYRLPSNAVICMYGGNLGKPQGLDFLIDVLEKIKNRDDVFFLIVGSGTEYTRIEAYLSKNRQSNARLMTFMPKDDYDQLMVACDIGLIFLHPNFTIPNFPSRLTAYMEASLPILAATDVNTDIKDVLVDGEYGVWAKNGDIDAFMTKLNLLVENSALRVKMGMAGRKYLEKYYTVARSCDIIENHLDKQRIGRLVKKEGIYEKNT